MKKVLVPVDFSACSEDALQHALQCPCNETRQLILLHVVDLFDVADLGLIGLEEYEDRLQQELVNDAENKLRDLIVRHSDTSLHLDSRVIIDRPWHGIIRTAISGVFTHRRHPGCSRGISSSAGFHSGRCG